MRIDTNITIFGGTGDLTLRKLLPALYTMFVSGKMPKYTRIVIIGRRAYDDATYGSEVRSWVEKFTRLPYQGEKFLQFTELVHYYRMDLSNYDDYLKLNDYYERDEIQSHIFYFAVAPRFFPVITQGLEVVTGAAAGKVIIEKPFGENLEAGKILNQKLERYFGADKIYRIDHYLGKEMVRNIQTIRFANPIFTDVWNSKYIESVQISALENVGVETRGGYYDTSGALEDMMQNHLFQILSIIAMERPEGFTGDDMHKEQIKVLKALRPADEKTIVDMLVLGQYEGYLKESKVAPDSSTETFAGLRLQIDNKRWEGTPFYIWTGKKTGKRQMEVSIVFRRPVSSAEGSLPLSLAERVESNILTIKIQPTEGVYLQFNIKRPGDTDEIIPTQMDFCQNCSLAHQLNTPEAYERLLTACMKGERAWFSKWDQIEISWNYMEQLKALYSKGNIPVYAYEPGSGGPEAFEELLGRFGHSKVD